MSKYTHPLGIKEGEHHGQQLEDHMKSLQRDSITKQDPALMATPKKWLTGESLFTMKRSAVFNSCSTPTNVIKDNAPLVSMSSHVSRRKKAQVEKGVFWGGWFDSDGTPLSFDDFVGICDTCFAGHAYTIYTSSSHDPAAGKYKYRVIWEFSTPVIGGDLYTRHMLFMNNIFAGQGVIPDRKNEGPQQMFYLPNIVPGSVEGVYRWHSSEGPCVDPVEFSRAVGFPPEKAPRDVVDWDGVNTNFAALIEGMEAAGVVWGEQNDGLIIECPNADAHTDAHREALLFYPSGDNEGKGGFSCFHSHCEGLADGKGLGTLYAKYTTVDYLDTFPAPPAAPVDVPNLHSNQDVLIECASYNPEEDPGGKKLEVLVKQVSAREKDNEWFNNARNALGANIGGVGRFDAVLNNLAVAHTQEKYDTKRAVGCHADVVAELGAMDLIMTEATKGMASVVMKTFANVLMILEELSVFKNTLVFNELTGTPWWTENPGLLIGQFPRELEDDDVSRMRAYFDRVIDLINVAQGDMGSATMAACKLRRINPLKDWLKALEWDGEERLSRWLTTYCGADNNELNSAFGRKTLISAVARAINPGCKVDTALILIGPQGLHKSSLVSALASEAYFSDSLTDLRSKDAMQLLSGEWIIELPELAALKATGVDDAKAFLTRRMDRFRPPYAATPIKQKRSCIFMGTHNPSGDGAFLQDDTGGRRFWGVDVNKCDVKGIERDREQLFAEAVMAYYDNEPWWLEGEIEAQAAVLQSQQTLGDPWDVPIAKLLGIIEQSPGDSWVTADAIMTQLDIPVERQNQTMKARVGKCIIRAGWGKKGKRMNGKKRATNGFHP